MENDAYYASFALSIAAFPAGAIPERWRRWHGIFANGAPARAHLYFSHDDYPTGVAALEYRENVVAVGHVNASLQRGNGQPQTS